MSHADFSPWISKNKKELVNSFPQKIALLVCECFFFTPRVLTAPAIQREITTPGGGGGQMLPYIVYIGIYCCEGDGFQAVYYGIGYRNQRVWV